MSGADSASDLDVGQTTERLSTVLKSLDEFDKLEVRAVINALPSPSRREQCFIGTYRRSAGNIVTLQELKSAKHFQAIVMLARTLFELAVDIRLLGRLSDGCLKMLEFVDAEKLRCARKVLTFKKAYPDSKIDISPYAAFISSNEQRIEATRRTLWQSSATPQHWSGMKMSERAKLLGPLFEEIYEVHYPYLSWQVHSGLTGVVNLNAETFTIMSGQAFKLAGDSFRETLLAMVEEFKLENTNPHIKRKLEAARLLPFADGPEQILARRQRGIYRHDRWRFCALGCHELPSCARVSYGHFYGSAEQL
jgi:hypothetical protein